jgi:hypothetical protein
VHLVDFITKKFWALLQNTLIINVYLGTRGESLLCLMQCNMRVTKCQDQYPWGQHIVVKMAKPSVALHRSLSFSDGSKVDSSWNVMAHGDAGEGKWRGNWRMECLASTLHTTSEHGASSITTADAHTSAASSRLNWRPCRFKWTRPFRRKTKSGFCACAITFQPASASRYLSKPYQTYKQLRSKCTMLKEVRYVTQDMNHCGCLKTSW